MKAKWMIVVFAALLGVSTLFAAEPIRWTDDASTWKLVARTDRSNEFEKVKAKGEGERWNLHLSGMVIGARHPCKDKRTFEMTVRARGKGRMKAYLFEYVSSATNALIDVTAWPIDVDLTEDFQDYVCCVEICKYHNASFAAVAVDAADAEIAGATVAEMSEKPKTAARPRPRVVLPMRGEKKAGGGGESRLWRDNVFREEDWVRSGVTFRNCLKDSRTGRLSTRQGDVFLAADRDYLYVAQRVDIPPGGIRSEKTTHDSAVYLDESVELWVNPDGSDTPEHVYQIISNQKCATFDQDHHLSIGQNNVMWNCSDYACRRGVREKPNGKVEAIWLTRVGFRSVGIADPTKPFALTVGHNFSAAGANGGSLNGAAWNDPKQMVLVRVAEDAPALELKMNDLVGDGLYRLELKATGKVEGGKAVLSLLSPARTNAVALADGVTATLDATDRKLLVANFDAKAVGRDGTVYLADELELSTGDFSPKEVTAAAGGEKSNLTIENRIFTKRLNLRWPNATKAEAAAVAKAEAEVTAPSGKKTVISEFTRTDWNGIIDFTAPFAPDEEGEFGVVARVLAKDGKVLAGGKRKMPYKTLAWVGNDLGKEDVVVPPYTALQTREVKVRGEGEGGTEISCLLRKHLFGANGLLKSVVAADGEVLAAPMEFVVETAASSMPPYQTGATSKNGRARSMIAPPSFKITKQSATRVEFTAENRYDGLKIILNGWMEYDGFLWYTMRLVPEKPIALTRLALRMTYANPSLFHFTQKGIRNEWHYFELAKDFGQVKGEDGKIWSTENSRASRLNSTFMPFFWLGTNKRGLMWFAENDRGWVNDEKSSSYDLYRRADGNYAMDVNFVSIPTTLAKTREIQFGLLANPLKPTPVGWGCARRPWDGTFGMGVLNLGAEVPDPWIANQMMSKDPKTSRLLYFAGEEYPKGDSEIKYIYDEMATWPRSYYTLALDAKKYQYIGPYTDNYLSLVYDWTPPITDFFVWRMKNLMDETRIDGIFLDNSYPFFSFDPLKVGTAGYIRDDGTAQPGSPILAARDFFKRLKTLIVLRGDRRTPNLVVHNTGSQYLPRFTFADGGDDGEMDIPKGGDHFDVFKSAWPETMLGVDWGFARSSCTMLGGAQATPKLMRACYACYRIYDMSIFMNGGHGPTYNGFCKIDRDFGVDAPDCTFTLWREQKLVAFRNPQPSTTNPQPDVRTSYYTRPGKKLIYMANQDKADCTVTFALNGALGDRALPTLLDAETGQPIAPNADGSYTLAIPGHDLRILLLKD